uniref:Uncharacterized protein n=1 Tax=Rhizophora mucronata TaxID=61149 RepID=A0A2P2PAV5_RHIMU
MLHPRLGLGSNSFLNWHPCLCTTAEDSECSQLFGNAFITKKCKRTAR